MAHRKRKEGEFLENSPFDKNVLVMMRYASSEQYDAIERAIREFLPKYGLVARLAKDREYDNDLWGNVRLYMDCCRFGIAVFEEIENREFNPNVSIELGYMLAKRKRCLILKEKRMPKLPTDLCGQLYKDFDMFSIERSIHTRLTQWMRDMGRYPLGILSVQEATEVLRQLVKDDFEARQKALGLSSDNEHRNWFIPDIGRCNVGELYIERGEQVQSVNTWLVRGEEQYLFIIGDAGIGKTNYLLMELVFHIMARDRLPTSPKPAYNAVFFLPLSMYNPDVGLIDNIEAVINLHVGSQKEMISSQLISEILKAPNSLLILDSLDGFLANHGEDACSALFDSVQRNVGTGSRVIIACRRHIYERLEDRGLFKHLSKYILEMKTLDPSQVEQAIRKRLGDTCPATVALSRNPALASFLGNPLYLDLMCKIPDEKWSALEIAETNVPVYNLWSDEFISNAHVFDELPISGFPELRKDPRLLLGLIAGMMLSNRTDTISEAQLVDNGLQITILEYFAARPYNLFIRQTGDEWSFAHDTFREFILAKNLSLEFFSRKYNILAKTSSFDYVSVETYAFLQDIMPKAHEFDDCMDDALHVDESDNERWNNVIRNSFEAIGIMGCNSPHRFIRHALELLDNPETCGTRTPSFTLCYNIVRCLERLHPSSPKPYLKHILQREWKNRPTYDCFGANAIRGFHRRHPEPGFFPPMTFSENKTVDQDQKEVSDCLLSILESLYERQKDETAEFLKMNCTFALIRWLYRDKNHISRVLQILENVSLEPAAIGNLFHALVRLQSPHVLKGKSKLFEGMELSWVYVTSDMVPDDFTLNSCRLHKKEESTFEITVQEML